MATKKKDEPEKAAVEPKAAEKADKGEVRADEKTLLQSAEQRSGTPTEGVDPFKDYVPDEGLHGNADY